MSTLLGKFSQICLSRSTIGGRQIWMLRNPGKGRQSEKEQKDKKFKIANPDTGNAHGPFLNPILKKNSRLMFHTIKGSARYSPCSRTGSWSREIFVGKPMGKNPGCRTKTLVTPATCVTVIKRKYNKLECAKLAMKKNHQSTYTLPAHARPFNTTGNLWHFLLQASSHLPLMYF